MPIDASIPLQVRQPEMPDMGNQLLKILQIQGLQDARTKEQRALDQETTMNDAYRGALGADGALDQNALLRAYAQGGVGSKIPALQKQFLENDNTKAQMAERNSTASKNNVEAENNIIGQYRNMVDSVQDPQSAIAFVTHMHQDPRLANSAVARAPLDQILARIPQDPAQIPAWKQEFSLGATKFQELNKPQFITSNTGSKMVTTGVAGLTGQATPVQSLTNTVSPDAQLSSDTSVKTTGMNNATSVKTTGMNNATSTANNRANIAKDYAVNGLNPDGTANTGNQGAMVDMLGNYQLNPALALQRLPAGQRAALVGQVQAKYPGWDETQYDAKKGAAAKFTSGDLGNALRSVSTANAHLDQLGDLADALGNGNTQIINRVGNYFATQMGDPKVTNFDSIKAIVGQEVVKAIVAGGGTGGERDEATHAFDSAKSPQQLKGVIQHYRAVMAAQQSNLLAQRDAAGLPRSTLPNYNGAAGGGTAAPAGWSVIGVHK